MKASLLAAGLCIAAPALVACAQPYHTVEQIAPLPGDYRFDVRGMNNRGECVGESLGSPITDRHPAIWRPGQGASALPFPPGFPVFSIATDINDAGTIVGFAQPSWDREAEKVGWKLQDGVFTMYPAFSKPEGINNANEVVGQIWGGFSGYFLDRPGQPLAMVAGTPGSGSTFRFSDINDAGDAAFSQATANPAFVLHRDGTVTNIPRHAPPYNRSFVHYSGNGGFLVGRYEYSTGSQFNSIGFAFSPEAGGPVQEIGGGANYIVPVAINAAGRIVGRRGNNRTSAGIAWYQDLGQGSRLIQELIDPATTVYMTDPHAINDRGQIAGSGTRNEPPPGGFITVLISPPGLATCDPDINCDGNPDQDDVACMIDVIAGNPGCECQDPDFNRDGNADQDDVAALINVVAGGGCP